MPQIDGQLKGAQLEEVGASSTTPAARSRIYADISDAANSLATFYNGTAWRILKTLHTPFVAKTANYTATLKDEIITGNANSAAFTITLPTAVGNTGKIFTIKKIDSSNNVLTIDGNSTETIDGSTTYGLGRQNDVLVIASDGSNWVIIAKYNLDQVQSKSTTYTALGTDDFIACDATSAAFTVTLPPAAGLTGKKLTIKKTDSSLNAITIDGNASETIDGSTTTTINTQNEAVRIVCDGSNWLIEERYVPSLWKNSLTFTATGAGTISNSNFITKRVGDSLRVRGRFTYGTGTGVDLKINLPTGIAISYSTWGAVQRSVGIVNRLLSVSTSMPGTSAGPFMAIVDGSTTNAVFISNNVQSAAFDKLQGNTTFSSGETLIIDFEIPVSGWNG